MKKTTKKPDGRGRPKTTGIFSDRPTLEKVAGRLKVMAPLTIAQISEVCGINWVTCRTILRDQGIL